MTHPGVEIFFAKKDKNMQVRILPARDTSYSPADSAFATSVLPYRRDDGVGVDTETQTELFTAWYVMVRGYRFFGKSGSDFLSPLTMAKIPGIDPMIARDPINDIRNYCYHHSDPAIKALSEKGSGGDKYKALIPSSSVYILVNALVNDGTKWHPGAEIYATTSAAFDDLKEALAVRRHDGCTNIPLDPVWGKYMLGDVTSLAHGAIANVVKRQVGTVSPWCFDYTTNKQQSIGYMPHPMDPNSAAAQEILRGRKDLMDTENVLKFLSYQEIVNLVAADGSIPGHIVEAACGGSCNLPSFPKQNTTYSTPAGASAPGGVPGGAQASPPGGVPGGMASPPGGAPGGVPGGVPGGAQASPPSGVPGGASAGPPAVAAQSTTAPGLPTTTAQPQAASTAHETVWVSQSGNVTEQSREAAQAAIYANPSTKVMSKDQSSGWVTGDKLGFALAVPQQSPPPPPPAAEAPTAPDPEEAGSIPGTDPDPEEAAPSAPIPTAPSPATPAVMPPAASPAAPPSADGSVTPVTADELAFVLEVKQLIQTKPEAVDGETLTKFTALNARAVKSGQIQTG